MANNIIFYFTGTGNSLKAGKDIANELSSSDIFPMVNFDGNLRAYERIGFVFPVYAGGLPNAVRYFFNRLNLNENMNSYYFAVATCGTDPLRLCDTFRPVLKGKMINVGYGNSIFDIKDILQSKGVKLNYGNRIVAYSNNILLHSMDGDIMVTIEKARQAAEFIGREVNKKTNRVTFQNRFFYKLMNSIFRKTVNDTDKSFNVNSNCNSCNLCSKICPARNISIENGKHIFLHKCEQCIACIQWCPKQAINYKNITKNRKRYHHPEIEIYEMFINNLNKI